MESTQGEVPATHAPIGAELADAIEQRLGQRLEYPDNWEEIAMLRDNIAILRELDVDQEALESTWDDHTLDVLKRATKDRLANHEHKLATGSLLARQSDDSIDWLLVGPRKSEARAVLKRTADEFEERSDADYPAWAFDDTCQTLARDALVEFVNETLDNLGELIPEPQQPPRERLGQKIGRTLLRRNAPEVAPYTDSILSGVSKTEDRRISRTVQKLNSELEQFIDAPYDWMCKAVIEQYRETIVSIAAASVDEVVVERNSALLLEKPVEKPVSDSARLHRPPKTRPTKHPKQDLITPEQPVRKASTKPAPTVRQRKLSSANEAEVDVTAAEVKLLGDFHLSVPWIQEGAAEPILIERVELDNKTAYIARCFTPQLEAISDAVRANTATKLGDLNPYDTTGQHVAKQLAYGIVPKQSTHTIKRVDSKCEAYGNLPVWYTFDASPNAQRVYFVVKKMYELTGEFDNGHETVDPNAYVMVVIAETDKQNQDDVLKAITGHSHQQVRSKRGGAI